MLGMIGEATEQALNLLEKRIGDERGRAVVDETLNEVVLGFGGRSGNGEGEPILDEHQLKSAWWFIRQSMSVIEAFASSELAPPGRTHAILTDGIMQYTPDEAEMVYRMLFSVAGVIRLVLDEAEHMRDITGT
jgi:hypothetical protein